MDSYAVKDYDLVVGGDNDLLISVSHDVFFDHEPEGEVMVLFDHHLNAMTMTMPSGNKVYFKDFPEDQFKLFSNSFDFVLAHTNAKDEIKPWLCIVDNRQDLSLH